jgi:hypothetical protein
MLALKTVRNLAFVLFVAVFVVWRSSSLSAAYYTCNTNWHTVTYYGSEVSCPDFYAYTEYCIGFCDLCFSNSGSYSRCTYDPDWQSDCVEGVSVFAMCTGLPDGE